MKTQKVETFSDSNRTEQAAIERQEARRKREKRAVKLGIFAFGLSLGGVVVEDAGGEVSATGVSRTVEKTIDGIKEYREHSIRSAEEAKRFDVDDTQVAAYRSELYDIIQYGSDYNNEVSPSAQVTIVDVDRPAERQTYEVDDDIKTRYQNDEASRPIVNALDSVHPALLNAAELKEIRIDDLGGYQGEYRHEDGIVYVDRTYSEEAAPWDIASVIHHEVGHEIHDDMSDKTGYPALVDFESENPEWWQYKSEFPEDSSAYEKYDMDKQSEGVTLRWYGTKSPREDFADYVSAIFDSRSSGLDGMNENHRNYLLNGNELTFDKTAAALAVLDEYHPGLGQVGLDEMGNKYAYFR